MIVRLQERFGVDIESESDGYGDVLRVAAQYLDDNPDLEVDDIRPFKTSGGGVALTLGVTRNRETN